MKFDFTLEYDSFISDEHVQQREQNTLKYVAE